MHTRTHTISKEIILLKKQKSTSICPLEIKISSILYFKFCVYMCDYMYNVFRDQGVY